MQRSSLVRAARRRGARIAVAAGLASVACFAPFSAAAFVYPEHRDIGAAAVDALDGRDRAALDALWKVALPAFRGPMCASVVTSSRDSIPRCVDFAALPALAGDHSCSPDDLVGNVLPSAFVLDVARVGAETRAAIASAQSESAIANASTSMNLELQSVDPDYLSRAGANAAHFLLARETDSLAAYVEASTREGAPLNALGLYLQYHTAALALAHELAVGSAEGQPRATAARDAIALETFALHWLEDSFASGHAAGTWGDDAWRKGTHDYYCEHGLDMTTWAGERMLAFGDSHMKAADLARASAAVARSLTQLVHALDPADPLANAARLSGPGLSATQRFDACRARVHLPPRGLAAFAATEEAGAILRAMPMPGRGPSDVHLPRFRQELGFFAGGFGGVAGSLDGGETGQVGLRPSIELAGGLRVGYAAPSIVGTIGTAKAFVESGFVMQSSQAQRCVVEEGCRDARVAELLPRVSSRVGLRIGLRLPFYVVPGDMVVLAPLLAVVAPRALPRVAVAAIRGGLVPYERSFRTSLGTVQVVAGREAEITLFGYLADALEVRPIGRDPATGDDVGGAVAAKSVRARFPVVEWTPLRSFATNLTFSLPIQAGFGLEVPTGGAVVIPAGARDEAASTGWDVFVRMQLDVQYFFGAREDAR